ncbi:TetR/AcrR family transcriptional regulator [Mesorhizobium sp. M8A.F.Ca.ET.173.01.1.1]|nr:TetR/AcrR family transcriptional regulator [Mesorhizobium sp. M8A.F.Ca.ET.173.01.1.1]
MERKEKIGGLRSVRANLTGARDNLDISERHLEILEVAASLFAERGYAATSVREIGAKVGLLGGSLYHYIKSKEALFVQVHEMALRVSEDQILAAIARTNNPWERLEVACVTMLEIRLDPESLTMPLMNDFSSVPPETRQRLIVRRDEFELIFRNLIADLPLSPVVDRSLYRLLLLTLLNNVGSWYRKGAMSPAEIAIQIVTIFRSGGNG